MNRTIDDILSDTPETEIKKSILRATVTKRGGANDFVISDSINREINLEVDPKLSKKIEVGYTFDFYSPEKVNNDKLRKGFNHFFKTQLSFL